MPPETPSSDHENSEAPRPRRQGMLPEDGAPAFSQSTSPLDTAAFQGQYQQIYTPPLNPFSGQIEMQYAQGPNRQGLYDMGAMANALPQAPYRSGYGSGQQQQQQHQRYTPAGSNMMPHMVQFPNQPHMAQLANQQYYVPQHQIPHFYNTQMSPASQHHQQHQVGSSRGDMGLGYYLNPVMMNQPQAPVAGYYYTPSNQFPTQNSSIHHHLLQGQYFLSDGSSRRPGGSSPLQRNHNAGGSGGIGPGEGMDSYISYSGSRVNAIS